MGYERQKLNIPMCLALILFVLTMISIHLTSGLYARYATVATASDSARVAKFAVSGALDRGDVTLTYAPDAAGAYNMTVTNESEVTVEYSVSIVFGDENLPEDALNVTLGTQNGTWEGNTLTFSNVGTLEPGAGDQTYTLHIGVNDWSYITADVADGESVTKALNFTVNIHAVQVD